MKATLKKAIRDESGKVLILALIVLVVGGLILGPLLGLMSTGLASGRVYETKTAELYAADAGLEDAINWLVHGKPHAWPWSPGDEDGTWHRSRVLEINRNNVSVTVEVLGSLDDHKYRITSTAIGEGSGTTVVSVVKAPPRHLGCHYFTEGLKLTNSDDPLEGTIIVVGNVDLHNSVTLNATEVYIDGNLHLHQKSTLKADIICLTGSITMAQNTEIDADLHFVGEECVLTIDQPDSIVRGNISAEGNLKILIYYGNAASIEVEGDVYAPYGSVSLHLEKNKSVLKGDIYAGGSIDLTFGNPGGTHNGNRYPNYGGDAPFEILPCPELPEPQGPVVLSYEVSGHGG